MSFRCGWLMSYPIKRGILSESELLRFTDFISMLERIGISTNPDSFGDVFCDEDNEWKPDVTFTYLDL